MKQVIPKSKWYSEIDTELYVYHSPLQLDPQGDVDLYLVYKELYEKELGYAPISFDKFSCQRLTRSDFVDNYLAAIPYIREDKKIEILNEIDNYICDDLGQLQYFSTHKILSKSNQPCVRQGCYIGGQADFSECMFIMTLEFCLILFVEWYD